MHTTGSQRSLILFFFAFIFNHHLLRGLFEGVFKQMCFSNTPPLKLFSLPKCIFMNNAVKL